MYQNVDTTQDFHKYTVEWTPKNMIFKFDDVYKYEINIDKIMQGGTYSKNGQVISPMSHSTDESFIFCSAL